MSHRKAFFMLCIFNLRDIRPRLHSQRLYGCAGSYKLDLTRSVILGDPPPGEIKNADDKYGEAELLGTGPTTFRRATSEVRTRARQNRTGLSRSITAMRGNHAQRTSSSCCSSRRPSGARLRRDNLITSSQLVRRIVGQPQRWRHLRQCHTGTDRTFLC